MMQLRSALHLLLPMLPLACGVPPELIITVQPESETISQSAAILVSVTDGQSLDGVELAVDGRRVASLTREPYLFSVDTTSLDDGAHHFEATGIVAGAAPIVATRDLVVDNLPPRDGVVANYS